MRRAFVHIFSQGDEWKEVESGIARENTRSDRDRTMLC